MAKRKCKQRDEKAENLAKALAGIQDGTYANMHQAAQATGASVATISRRLRGGKTRREANAHRQNLSVAEEAALVTWIERLSSTGHPVR